MQAYRTISLIAASLLVIVIASFYACSDHDIIYKSIDTPDDIVDINSRVVQPIAYTSVVSLSDLDVKTRKQKFIDMMLPAILLSKEKLRIKRERATGLLKKEKLSTGDSTWLDKLKKTYRTEDPDKLLLRLNDHPTSIVLAQSAIETGWGTSRFFREANNAFGIWSYDTNEPRVKASESRDGKAVYLKKYKSLIEAVDVYFITIGRGPYTSFRKHRATSSDVKNLVTHLDTYSEISDEYVERLHSVIDTNKLQKYDDYVLSGKEGA
jgi:Bax protein